MANTPKDDKTRGQKQATKADFRNKAEAEQSEAKWFNPEPREEASTRPPETPNAPYSNTRLQQGEGHPGALEAGGASDTGDKSRNFETSRNADRLEPGQEGNSGIGADPNLLQNRRAKSAGVTNLGSAPWQGTGEEKTKGAGEEAAPADFSREREHQRDASRQTGATSGMTPAENLGTREQGHPGRRTPHDQPGTETTAQPRAAESPPESPQDMRDRQTRDAGADPRGMERQGKTEGPNAKQTQKRGVGDDTPRH